MREKECNLWDAIKFMKEDKTLEFTNGSTTIGLCEMGYLEVKKTCYGSCSLDENIQINSMWKEVEKKSMSFNEVLKTHKRCICKHDIIDKLKKKECYCDDKLLKSSFDRLISGEYMSLNRMITILSWMLSVYDFEEVLENGKWYIE